MHLAVPLRRETRPDGTRGLALHEQDSPEEITACIYAVLNTPVGHRIDLPEFGTPRQEHRRGGADLAIIEQSIATWEPRADVDVMRDTGALTEMAREAGLDTVKIGER